MTRKMRQLRAPAMIVVVLLLTRVGVAADEIRVMTSGAFTAAYSSSHRNSSAPPAIAS